MYVIRNVFVAKPGCAGKLAAQLKDAMGAFEMPDGRVLTDVTGDFNRVIMEYSAGDLAEFEQRMKAIMASQAYKDRMVGYTELWVTGSREILRVV